ncbi:MAG: adenylosuccinate synthase, partial [Thermoanaerobaculia bacterium]
MANTVVLGMQWGDEGKGKIVDLICPAFDAVARFQGGDNAGHTVKFADRHFALHLLPSGILQPEMRCVLGNGMVICPDSLFGELDEIRAAGVDVEKRLFVSGRAQVILPTHIALDQAREAARGDRKIGTTARGIGPAYESKAGRYGVRCGDLLADDLEDRLAVQHRTIAAQLADLGADPPPSVAELVEECRVWGERLRPYVHDTVDLLNRWIDDGDGVLFEGAQGALLDIDHGTYPYVTSSNVTAGGVCAGTGVPPMRLTGVLGVIKAYTTRVGGGPFTTELDDKTGEHLRRRGNEFGTTTGRPRRCGWFDAVAARYSRRINGTDVLAVTKLDVLDELDTIRLCVAYRVDGREIRDFPMDLSVLERAEPVYRDVPGWNQSTVGILDEQDLPGAARDYLAILEEAVGAPVGLISTGPRREETILVECIDLLRLLSYRQDRIVRHR